MNFPIVKVIHFHNGTGGGVLSVIRNLLAYRQNENIENHVIYTINREEIPNYMAPGLLGAASEQIFYYSPKWNFYYTCRQLAKLLPKKDSFIIVAHDWLELGMVSNMGLQYPVVQFLHGDYEYYYNLAKQHYSWIESFICVSSSISNELKKRLPEQSNDIHYLRFPVQEVIGQRKNQTLLHLLFAGRCEDAKGYHLLPLIDAALKQKNIQAHWHIAGPGSENYDLQQLWKHSDVFFYGILSSEELIDLLYKVTAFVLPSLAEGMPVSIVEAMKSGAIPVVNDLQGGMQEIIINDVTGYRIPKNDPLVFAEKLADLALDLDKQLRLSNAAMEYANRYFDPIQNTLLIENCFLQIVQNVKKKIPIKKIGSRLDQIYLPNFLVSIIRSINLKS